MGQTRFWFDSVSSTNQTAAELASQRDFIEGSAVIAKEQKAGRGQAQKGWDSFSGKDFMGSVLLKPTFIKAHQSFLLNIFSSLAVADVVCHYGIKPQVKWPNDIFIGNKKVSGILIENRLKAQSINQSIIGIGLNVNGDFSNSEFQAISLSQVLGRKLDLLEVEARLMEGLEKRYLQLKSNASLKTEYMNLLMGYHEEVILEIEGVQKKGKILHLDESGRIDLRFGSEDLHQLAHGEVKIIAG